MSLRGCGPRGAGEKRTGQADGGAVRARQAGIGPGDWAGGEGRSGQASVELLGALPVLLLLGLVLFQLLAVGYAAVLAGNAAEAGALSHAGGGEAEDAAREALPGWSHAGMEVEVDGGRVEVSLEPPSPVEAVAEELEVSSTAAVRAPRS